MITKITLIILGCIALIAAIVFVDMATRDKNEKEDKS